MEDTVPRQTLTNQGLPPALRGSIVASLAVHVIVVVGLVIGTTGTARSHRTSETVITTKLVRLGKERPKELLPRKEEAPAPAAKAVAVAADKSNEGKVPTSAKDANGEKRSLSDVLNRMKKNSGEAPEGHPDGVEDGEVSSLAQALVGNRYATEIYRCVKSNYAIEALPRERIVGKVVTATIRVQKDGMLFDFKLEKSSGVPAFDRAVEKAIKRCGKVSPPPPELANQVRGDGIQLDFTP